MTGQGYALRRRTCRRLRMKQGLRVFFVFEKVCMLLWQFICRKHGFCLDFLYNMNELLMMLWKDWYIYLILRKYILLEPSI